MASIRNYIQFFPNVLDEDLCELLILSFSMSNNRVERVKNKVIDFTQLNINHHCANLVSNLVSATRSTLEMYKHKLQEETKHFPTNTMALEEFRMKCYNGRTGQQCRGEGGGGGGGGGGVVLGLVCNLDSSRSFLAFLFYLNDDFTGGETLFFDDTKFTPKSGSVLVFPPTWQYPHAGLPVDTGNKYILSTYLHYT